MKTKGTTHKIKGNSKKKIKNIFTLNEKRKNLFLQKKYWIKKYFLKLKKRIHVIILNRLS